MYKHFYSYKIQQQVINKVRNIGSEFCFKGKRLIYFYANVYSVTAVNY
jgi:hypothetical protein